MELLPETNCLYENSTYWNQRYLLEESFEWLGSYNLFQRIIKKNIQKNEKILILGCGNSCFSEDLYQDGFYNIINIDYSDVVIEKMRIKSAEAKMMKWLCMDMNNLTFSDEEFDVVIEKATLDSIMVNERNPWKVSENTASKIDKILTEVSRVLKPHGRFLSITFAQPHFRIPLYAKNKYNWSVSHETFGIEFHYFAYVMTKGEELDNKFSSFLPSLMCPVKGTLEPDNEDFILSIDVHEDIS